ncbi:hypothetical protein [Streptomyces sp. NPDC055058]
MVPTPGRIVLYRLTEEDAKHITHQRVQGGLTGNFVREGDRYPAIVVKTFPANPADVANLRVLLDGQDLPLWVTSCHRGTEPGMWTWPERT